MNRFEGETVIGTSAGLAGHADVNAIGTVDSEIWR
jgi:hypothetical protein